jgi:hypothetical protein
MATQYWVGDVVGGDNWSNVNAWAAASGGAGGTGTVPLAGDTTYFDAASLRSCTVDAAAATGTLDCTGFTQTLTLAAALAIDGATFTLSAGMTFTPASFKVSFVNSAAATVNITSAGQGFYDIELGPAAGNNGVWTLIDALVVGRDFLFTRGIFAANNKNTTTARDHLWASTLAADSFQAGSGTHTIGRNLTYSASKVLSKNSFGTSTFVFSGDGQIGNSSGNMDVEFYNLNVAPAGKTLKSSMASNYSFIMVYNQLTTGPGTVEYGAGIFKPAIYAGMFSSGLGQTNPFNIDPGCTWKCSIIVTADDLAPTLDIRPANYQIVGDYIATRQHTGSIQHTCTMKPTGNVTIVANNVISFGQYGYDGVGYYTRLDLNGFDLVLTAPSVWNGGYYNLGYQSVAMIIGAQTLTVNGNLTFEGSWPRIGNCNLDTRLAALAGGVLAVNGNLTYLAAFGDHQAFELTAGSIINCTGNWNTSAGISFIEASSYGGILRFNAAGSPTVAVNLNDKLPIVQFSIGGSCTLPAGFNCQQLVLLAGTLTTAGALTIRELYNGSLGTTFTITGDCYVGSGFTSGGTVITTGSTIYTTRPLCSLSGFNPVKVVMGRNNIRLQLTGAMNIGKLVLQGQRHAPGILQFKAGSTYVVGDLDSELDMPDCPVQFISSVAGTAYNLNVTVNSSTDYIWPRDCNLGGGASPITGDISNKDLDNNSGWNLPGKGVIRVITDDPGQDTLALGDPGDYQFCWLVATSKAALTTLSADFANGHHNWHRRTYLPYAELDALAIGTKYFIGLGLRNADDDRLAPNIAAGDYIEKYADSSLGGGVHSIFSNFQTPVV